MKSLTRFLKNLLGNRIKVHQVNRDCITLIPKEPFIQWVIGVLSALSASRFVASDSEFFAASLA